MKNFSENLLWKSSLEHFCRTLLSNSSVELFCQTLWTSGMGYSILVQKTCWCGLLVWNTSTENLLVIFTVENRVLAFNSTGVDVFQRGGGNKNFVFLTFFNPLFWCCIYIIDCRAGSRVAMVCLWWLGEIFEGHKIVTSGNFVALLWCAYACAVDCILKMGGCARTAGCNCCSST